MGLLRLIAPVVLTVSGFVVICVALWIWGGLPLLLFGVGAAAVTLGLTLEV